MNINSDINVLGSLSDFNLIISFLKENIKTSDNKVHEVQQVYSNIKTLKSFKRFKTAINNTLIKFYNPIVESLICKVINTEGISSDSLLVLFWNASINNELLNYLNQQVYFPAFYSGRVTIKTNEVVACLQELKRNEKSMLKWSDSTVNTNASKYLTLLKKFLIMKGRLNKTLERPYLNDKLLIIFVYLLLAIDSSSNLLESKWLNYCFLEKEIFIQRIMQKKFMKYFNLDYTGAKLKIETTVPYEEIYDKLK
ncbi:MAG: DUF1819 family protein [Desulfobacterales bacterium]|nr:DUF1819 family protein [Desulfobacterales bacterium]